MIIHTYFTDGYIGWARLFIESFKFHHGQKNRLVIDTRNLTNENIKEIKSLYKNIEIRNKEIDMDDFCKQSGLSMERALIEKNRTEREEQLRTRENIMWKLYIAAQDRYRNAIPQVLKDYMKKKDADFLYHFDIDTFFRKPINPLITITKKNDISIINRVEKFKKFKNKPPKHFKMILACFLGIKFDPKVFKFFDSWKKHLDNIPLKDKPLGYGQSSMYYAYLENLKNIKWGKIPEDFVDRRTKKDTIIWPGNKGDKTQRLNICLKEWKRIKKHGKKT